MRKYGFLFYNMLIIKVIAYYKSGVAYCNIPILFVSLHYDEE